MNVKMFNAVMKVMEEEPRRANMYSFRATNIVSKKYLPEVCDVREQQKSVPPCGTVGCIAGWADAINERGNIPNTLTYGTIAVVDTAREKLDLSKEQASNLFWSQHWPQPFRDKLMTTRPGTKAHVKVIVARMKHMLETGL